MWRTDEADHHHICGKQTDEADHHPVCGEQIYEAGHHSVSEGRYMRLIITLYLRDDI